MTERERKVKEDNWKYRRLAVFGSLGPLLGMMGYLTVMADGNNAVQSMLAQSIPVAIIGIIITYIGGPIADDFVQFKINRS
jgi:hypothetical protein